MNINLKQLKTKGLPFLTILAVLVSNTLATNAQVYENNRYIDSAYNDGYHENHEAYVEFVNFYKAPSKITRQLAIPSGLQIPVRFKYETRGDELQINDGLVIEVVEDVYASGSLLFRQGNTGTARVSGVDRASFFGRGGSIEINSGDITDIYGNKHIVSFSSAAKGSGTLGPLVLTLLASGIAVAAVPDLLFKSTESTLFGAGLALSPIYFAMKKGKEATVSNAKVIYASHISPDSISIKN